MPAEDRNVQKPQQPRLIEGDDRLSRRSFLGAAGLGVGAMLGGAGAAALAQGDEGQPRQPSKTKDTGMKYRKLGRTGLLVSEVSYGAIAINGVEVVHELIDHGVNYIDTAHCYLNGNGERRLAPVLRERRDEVHIATKWHLGKSKTELIQSCNDSLAAMGVEHIDVIQIHGASDAAMVQDQAVQKAFGDCC